MSVRTALIVGAGIGGLAAGVALQRAGWWAGFERSWNSRELGFALMLAPNALAALRELGLAEAVMQHPRRLSASKSGSQAVECCGGSISDRQLRRLARAQWLRYGQRCTADCSTQSGLVHRLDAEATAWRTTGSGVAVSFAAGGEATGDVLVGARTASARSCAARSTATSRRRNRADTSRCAASPMMPCSTSVDILMAVVPRHGCRGWRHPRKRDVDLLGICRSWPRTSVLSAIPAS